MSITYYEIWRTNELSSNYEKIGTTRKPFFEDTTAEVGQTYCYYLVPVANSKISYDATDVFCVTITSINQIIAISINEGIGTLDFKSFSDAISESISVSQESLENVLGVRQTVLNTNSNQDGRFLQQIKISSEATYSNIVNKSINRQHPLTTAVRSLNEHVLSVYGHEEMDDFLREQFLKVDATYASISYDLGYIITEIGSRSARFEDIDIEFDKLNNINFERIGWKNV